jgi:putative transposase
MSKCLSTDAGKSRMEDYNTVHPHSRLGYRSPREYIMSQPVACPV